MSELNDDQKKTIATLPTLEATLKELEDVKKATEVIHFKISCLPHDEANRICLDT